MSGRWLHVWVQLWPAVLVWLGISLPVLAYYSPSWDTEARAVLPWWFRAFTWCVVHTWPYTKVARVGARFARWDRERAEERRARSCVVCRSVQTGDVIEHALTHLPGEVEAWDAQWWKPPPFTSQEEADRWLAARQATGEDFWE